MANVKIGLDISELLSELKGLNSKIDALTKPILFKTEFDSNELKNGIEKMPTRITKDVENAGEKVGKDFKKGVKSETDTFGDLFKNALSFAGGGLLASGLTGAFNGVKEALKAGDDAADRLTTSFQQAKLSGKGLADELARSGQSAKGISNDFALPVNQIKGLQAQVASFGGITGEMNDRLVKLSLGAASSLGVAPEALAKMIAKANDPEQVAGLKKIGIEFEKNATIAEKLAVVEAKFGPTVKASMEGTQDIFGTFERIKNAVTDAFVQNVLPLLDEFNNYLQKLFIKYKPEIESFGLVVKKMGEVYFKLFSEYLKITWDILTSIISTIFELSSYFIKLGASIFGFNTTAKDSNLVLDILGKLLNYVALQISNVKVVIEGAKGGFNELINLGKGLISVIKNISFDNIGESFSKLKNLIFGAPSKIIDKVAESGGDKASEENFNRSLENLKKIDLINKLIQEKKITYQDGLNVLKDFATKFGNINLPNLKGALDEAQSRIQPFEIKKALVTSTSSESSLKTKEAGAKAGEKAIVDFSEAYKKMVIELNNLNQKNTIELDPIKIELKKIDTTTTNNLQKSNDELTKELEKISVANENEFKKARERFSKSLEAKQKNDSENLENSNEKDVKKLQEMANKKAKINAEILQSQKDIINAGDGAIIKLKISEVGEDGIIRYTDKILKGKEAIQELINKNNEFNEGLKNDSERQKFIIIETDLYKKQIEAVQSLNKFKEEKIKLELLILENDKNQTAISEKKIEQQRLNQEKEFATFIEGTKKFIEGKKAIELELSKGENDPNASFLKLETLRKNVILGLQFDDPKANEILKLITEKQAKDKIKLLIELDKLTFEDEVKKIENDNPIVKLGVDFSEIFSDEILKVGEKLRDNENKNLENDKAKKIDSIKKQKEEITSLYKSGEISAQKYHDKVLENSKNLKDAISESTKKSGAQVGDLFSQSLSNTFKILGTKFNDEATKGSEIYKKNQEIILGSLVRQKELEKEGKQNTKEYIEQKNIQKKLEVDNNLIIEDSLKKVGTAVALNFASMLTSGANFIEASGEAFFKGLEAMIPTFVAYIFGSSFLAGPLGWLASAGTTAVLYGLLESARGAINHHSEGVVNLSNSSNKGTPNRRDTIPALLEIGESVITAKGTFANGNKDLFNWINTTGGSAIDYFKNDKNLLIDNKNYTNLVNQNNISDFEKMFEKQNAIIKNLHKTSNEHQILLNKINDKMSANTVKIFAPDGSKINDIFKTENKRNLSL